MVKAKKIPFTNDFMFSLVMRDEQLCIDLLRLILPEDDFTAVRIEEPVLDLENTEITTQAVLKFAEASRGVRFDAYIKSKDVWAEIEMQTYTGDDIAKRSRYYQANMDMDALEKGCRYRDLPGSYVIFICTYDYMGKDEPIYYFRNFDEKNRLLLGDNTCKIIMNTKCTPEKVPEKLRAFYRYLNDPDSGCGDEFVERLDNRVEKYNTAEWRRKLMTLGELMERNHEKGYEEGLRQGRESGLREGRESGLREGHESGIKEGRRETAIEMKRDGVPVERIIKYTGLTEAEIRDLN